MAFATTSDVEALAGRSLTASEAAYATTLLDKATSIIQVETRQILSVVTGDVWIGPRSFARAGIIRLPQRPVIQVSSVVIDGIELTTNDYDVDLNSGILEYWGGPRDVFYPVRPVVTYDHGYSEIPPILAEVCSALVWASILNPQGLRQFTLGDYSGTFVGQAASVGMALTDDQKNQLIVFKRNATAFRT